jgi:hypothetical protein
VSAFEDVRAVLQAPPYRLRVREKGALYLVKYAELCSDFDEPVVRQARGVILEKDSNAVVCHAFDKFWAVGSPRGATLEAATTRFFEKLDGSLVKLYCYAGRWRWATNGMIDAADAGVGKAPELTFQMLIDEVVATMSPFDWEALDPSVCFSFELLHPASQVVVAYGQKTLVLLGARDLRTGAEMLAEEARARFAGRGLPADVRTAAETRFASLDDCIAVAVGLPATQEGFVAVDARFRRVKVKAAAYLALHSLCTHDEISATDRVALIAAVLHDDADEARVANPRFSAELERCAEALTRLWTRLYAEYMPFAGQRKALMTCAQARADLAPFMRCLAALCDDAPDSMAEAVEVFKRLPAKRWCVWLDIDARTNCPV